MFTIQSHAEASQWIHYLAVGSRVFFVILLAGASFLPVYDKSSLLNQPPTTILSTITNHLAPFCSWDGEHFASITSYGYTTEQSFAFFPGFPIFVRACSFLFKFAYRFIPPEIVHCVVGSAISNFCYVLFIRYLFTVNQLVLGHWRNAYITTVLYIFLNPSNVFFSVNYSESVYNLLFILGITGFFAISIDPASSTQSIRLVQSNLIPTLSGTLLLFLATFVKSMGIFNIIFVLFSFLLMHNKNYSMFFTTLIYSIIAIFPFFSFQLFAYYQLPFEFKPDIKEFYKIYSKIQTKYWNLGKFTFWHVEQLPNFILAFPFVSLSFVSIVLVFSLHITQLIKKRRSKLKRVKSRKGKTYQIGQQESSADSLIKNTFESFGLASNFTIPFLVHFVIVLGFLLIFGHVQTIPRLLSNNPLIYWVLGYFLSKKGILKSIGLIFSTIFVFQSIFGAFLFSTFNPYT
ncbi:hypothetical protein P9112_000097 [Eukaryota sp. TZLM1-RC]